MADPTKPSKYAAKNRAYYLANRERLLAYQKEYRLANLDTLREKQRLNRLKTLDALWDKKLRREKGISLADYHRLFQAQGGVCAICGLPEYRKATNGRVRRYLSVDHDHKTGQVRGLLCGGCNAGLGHFGDDLERVTAAVRYLRRPVAPAVLFQAPAKEAIA